MTKENKKKCSWCGKLLFRYGSGKDCVYCDSSCAMSARKIRRFETKNGAYSKVLNNLTV